MERHTDRWMERQTDTGRQKDRQADSHSHKQMQAENGKIINSPAESGCQATNFAKSSLTIWRIKGESTMKHLPNKV